MLRRGRLLVVGVLLVTAAAAAADPAEESTKHFHAGREHVKSGRCDLAMPEFRASAAAKPNVGALLNLAECLEQLGDFGQAYAAFRDAQALAAERRDDRLPFARAGAERVEAKSVRLVVRVDDRSELEVDGQPVARAAWSRLLVRPGVSHRIVVRHPDRGPLEHDVTARPGESVEISNITTATTASTASSPETAPAVPAIDGGSTARTLGFVTGGAGIAALGAGFLFGAFALSSREDLANAVDGNAACRGSYPNAVCDPSARAAIDPLEDTARTQGLVSSVLVIGGAILVTAGITLLVVGSSSTARSSARASPVRGLTW
jgi:hypothetical protein